MASEGLQHVGWQLVPSVRTLNSTLEQNYCLKALSFNI